MSKKDSEHAGDILVVDDVPANLQLLSALLKERGYKVRPVPSGRLALQAVARQPPDLILLDINMPEMNGYEVCERLGADPRLSPIPVIFISALDETIDKVRAFAAGGVDYLTKPFEFEEIRARVETHLRLRRQALALERHVAEIEDLQQLRDSLVHMLVHDLRSPLSVISTYLEILTPPASSTDDDELWSSLKAALGRVFRMVDDMLDVHRLEGGDFGLQREAVELRSLAEEVARSLHYPAEEFGLEISVGGGRIHAQCDPELIRRVITNLAENALKYGPRGSQVRLEVEAAEGEARVSVSDEGMGVPPDQQERIFAKFGTVLGRRRERRSIGLGLAFCRMVVEAHGGRIGVESEGEGGSLFFFTLPT